MFIQPNTFQAVIASHGSLSYAVFTYQCDFINWTKENDYAAVGYTAGPHFFQNHPLSRTTNVVNIDCVNQPTSIWSNIIYKLTLHPDPVTDVSVTVGQTTATISFTVPAIAYTPETYNINYTGLEFQSTLTSSSQVMSTVNITDVNVRYQITLSNLEEANTYNFTVVSTNCIGSTSTVVMNFTTLPSSKCNTICIVVSIYSTCCSTNQLYKHHLPPS